MNSSILNKVIEQLRRIPEASEKQVLEFAKPLNHSTIRGVPRSQLLRFAGAIAPDDIVLMREGIEQNSL